MERGPGGEVSVLLLFLFLASCGAATSPDAGPEIGPDGIVAVEATDTTVLDPWDSEDADASDTTPADPGSDPVLPDELEPDADDVDATPVAPGPIATKLCALGCTADTDCGPEGWACLTFQDSGQRFCAPACPSSGCPEGFACVDVGGLGRCVPLRGDCATAFAGLPCDGEALAGFCKHDFDLCTSPDWRPGVCTHACTADTDCGGFGRCVQGLWGDRVCAPFALDGPDGCGAALTFGATPGESCRDDGDCGGGRRCVQPDAALAHPFCAPPCADVSDCGQDEACALPHGATGGAVCLPAACACLADDAGLAGQLLAALGLSRCEVGFRSAWLRVWPVSLAFDDWRLPLFHALHDVPSRALARAGQMVASLDAHEALLPRARVALQAAAGWLDRGFEPQDIPVQPSLGQAIVDLRLALGESADDAGIAAELAKVPPELTERLGPIVAALQGVYDARVTLEAELAGADSETIFRSGHGLVVIPKSLTAPAPANPGVRQALLSDPGVRGLYRAAERLLHAVEAADLAQAATDQPFSATIDTPLGPILLRGGGDDTYNASSLNGHANALLVVDTGGDDLVLVPAGATADPWHPVSLHLDLGGNDTYTYVPVTPAPDPALLPADADGRWVPDGSPDTTNGPVSLSDVGRQGSGRLGVGVLIDLGGGDDVYQSLRLSQGYGFLGVGALLDDGGTDTYAAEALSQGAAMFGIGLLIDEGGPDTYRSVSLSQGFAYARGAGVLYDTDGNDAYTALPGDPALGGVPLYYSPQNPGKSNSSMSQGVGFGRRADQIDGVYMSGGLGLLRDASGEDTYVADIFGQASGYWFGVGILADGAGNDTYDGRWYVQGSAAHFASALFLEGGGDDRYQPTLPPLATSIGVGHDFSLGLVDEAGGNDTWVAPGLALGSGNSNGLGILLERGGDDTYASPSGGVLGWANGADRGTSPGFEHLPTIGLFLDAGGADTYGAPTGATPPPADDTAWIHPPTSPENAPVERGGGSDGVGPIVLP